jgi:hypothetical protein
MGKTPHVARKARRLTLQVMKTNRGNKTLKFGLFIANVHEVCGKRKAGRIERMAFKPHPIEFRKQQRFMID